MMDRWFTYLLIGVLLAITAGLFLKRFMEDLPWLHLDIAGTADGKSPLWQHQVGGATGAATCTLYHLAAGMEGM